MQFLMQSTKVKLNDSDWMENMYSKLVDEESRELEHTTNFRNEVEKQRVKVSFQIKSDMRKRNDFLIFLLSVWYWMVKCCPLQI
jgi:hypothetical protein